MTVTIPPPPAADYAPVPNATLRDHALTYAEKGMLAAIRSHAAHYTLTMEQLIREGADGPDAVRSILRSLEQKGYLARTPIRGYRGRIERYDYAVLDPEAALTACGPTASGATASGQAAPSHDQAEQGVSAGGTASGQTASGQPETKKTTTPTGEKTTEKTREPSTTSRGTRLPQEWKPSEELLAWFLAECVAGGRWSAASREALRREHATFVDWCASAPGSKGVKKNWDATWRNWMRRAFPAPVVAGEVPKGRQSFAEQDRVRREEGDRRAAAADALMERNPGMTARDAMAAVDAEIAKRVDEGTGHPYIDGEHREPRPEVTQ